ncbi:phosphoribosyltransferase [Candidatus Omnitrophota bacterium]
MEEISFRSITNRIDDLILPSFDLVIGIATGGIVPATLIAYKLGLDVRFIQLNFRGTDNKPKSEKPRLISEFNMPPNTHSALIVDDASISGATLESARKLVGVDNTKTLVLKGSADYTLFPEVESCVKWPWRM